MVEMQKYVDPFPGMEETAKVEERCGRCGGSGVLSMYFHIEQGRCFGCGGAGRWETEIRVLRNRERRRVARINAQIRKDAELKERADQHVKKFSKEFPEVWEWINLNALDPRNRFAHSLLTRIEVSGDLTEKQMEQVQRAAGGPDASEVLVPEGRQEIVGKVSSIREQASAYRHGQKERKMLVLAEEGWKVWGTLPAALSDAKVGDRVKFAATLTRSDDDQMFGFFKRPTKAERLV